MTKNVPNVPILVDILTSEVLHWELNSISPKPNNRDFNAIVPISLEVQPFSNLIFRKIQKG